MTRTVRTSLGHSPLSGKQGIDQALRFKEQLRSLGEKPPTVSLLTVTSIDPPRAGVVAFYDADDAVAVDWIKRAEFVAPELWRKMAERRTGVRGR